MINFIKNTDFLGLYWEWVMEAESFGQLSVRYYGSMFVIALVLLVISVMIATSIIYWGWRLYRRFK